MLVTPLTDLRYFALALKTKCWRGWSQCLPLVLRVHVWLESPGAAWIAALIDEGRRRLAGRQLQWCMWTRPQANVGRLKNTEEAKAFRRKLMARLAGTLMWHNLWSPGFTRNCILHPFLHNRSTLSSAPSGPSSIAEACDSLSLSPVFIWFIGTSLQRDPSQSRIQTECHGELHTCEPEWLKLCALLCAWFQSRCWRGANLY